MAWHNKLGKWGEDVAAEYLQKKGWYIRHRNWVHKHKELDIVCIDKDMTTVLVVEVKTRATDAFGAPELSVDLEKMNNTIRATTAYMHMYHLWNLNVRYDIIAITGTPENGYTINHKEGAFDSSASYQYNEQRRKSAYWRWKHRPGCW